MIEIQVYNTSTNESKIIRVKAYGFHEEVDQVANIVYDALVNSERAIEIEME